MAASDFAMFIYMGHEPLVSLMRKVAVRELGTDTSGLAVIWLGTAFGAIAMLVISAIALRRWMPNLYAVLSGERIPQRRTAFNAPLPQMAAAPA